MSFDGSGAYQPWSGSSGNVGAGQYSPLTATGSARPTTVAYESWTATGLVIEVAPGDGTTTFETWSATGVMSSPILWTGAGEYQKLTAAGGFPKAGAGSYEQWTSTGRGSGAITGAASYEPWRSKTAAGFAAFEKFVATGVVSVVLPETYAVKVVNLKTGAASEYTNYAFNSFARINGSWYGAGPDGLIRLDGTTDDGDAINWRIRTGQHDGGSVELKRLPEVPIGLRSNGKIRVRVLPNDNDYNDYMLPVVQKTTIHQHRVIVGKGMRSRYFAVELQGVENADLELDSLQINLVKTTRRLG